MYLEEKGTKRLNRVLSKFITQVSGANSQTRSLMGLITLTFSKWQPCSILSRIKCLQQLVTFENQSHRSKARKTAVF